MEALICDHKEDYDTDDTQDLYISNMNYSERLMEEVDQDFILMMLIRNWVIKIVLLLIPFPGMMIVF